MRKNLFYSFKSYVVSLGHPTLYYSRNISSSVGLLFKILNLKLPSWVDLKLCRLCFIVCFLTEGKALLACFCVTGEQSQKQHKMAKIYYDFCFFVVFFTVCKSVKRGTLMSSFNSVFERHIATCLM